MELVMRTLLAFALIAAPVAAQDHKPLRPATAEEQQARTASDRRLSP